MMSPITNLATVFTVLCVLTAAAGGAGAQQPLIEGHSFCVDETCSKAISEGTTLHSYSKHTDGFVTVQANKKVQIVSKSVDLSVYGISYQGQLGFISAKHIQEVGVKVTSSNLVKIATAAIPWSKLDSGRKQPAKPDVEKVVPAPEAVIPVEATKIENTDDVVPPVETPTVKETVQPEAVVETTATVKPDVAPLVETTKQVNVDTITNPAITNTIVNPETPTLDANTKPLQSENTTDVEQPTLELAASNAHVVNNIINNGAQPPPTVPASSQLNEPLAKSTPPIVNPTVAPAAPAVVENSKPVSEQPAETHNAIIGGASSTTAYAGPAVVETSKPVASDVPASQAPLLETKEDISNGTQPTAANPVPDAVDISKPVASDVPASQALPLETKADINIETPPTVANTVPVAVEISHVPASQAPTFETKDDISNGTPPTIAHPGPAAVESAKPVSSEVPANEVLPSEQQKDNNNGTPPTLDHSIPATVDNSSPDPSQTTNNTANTTANALEENSEEDIEDEDEDDGTEDDEDDEYDQEIDEQSSTESIHTNSVIVNETQSNEPQPPQMPESNASAVVNDSVNLNDAQTHTIENIQEIVNDSQSKEVQPESVSTTEVVDTQPGYPYDPHSDLVSNTNSDSYLVDNETEITTAAPEYVQHDTYYTQSPDPVPPYYPSANYNQDASIAPSEHIVSTSDSFTQAPPVEAPDNGYYSNELPVTSAPNTAQAQSAVIPPPIGGVGSVEEVTSTDNTATSQEGTSPDDAPIVGDLWGTISNWFGDSLGTTEQPQANEIPQGSAESFSSNQQIPISIGNNDYCDPLTNSCPAKFNQPSVAESVFIEHIESRPPVHMHATTESSGPLVAELGVEGIVQLFVDEAAALTIVTVYSFITGLITVLFLLGNRFVNKRRREQALLSKLNILERKLMTSGKECDLLKNSLVDTKHKLTSIEDNSFGSNEMVISLRQEVVQKTKECLTLNEQIIALEGELETATEAGLELNKMVSELLNNQTGSDSIISSVEEMQRQLNEQEETTAAINALLADKSRENSELQVKLLEVSDKYDTELADVVGQNERLIADLEKLQTELHELQKRSDEDRTKLTASSAAKLLAANAELEQLGVTYEKVRVANVSNEARVQVLEDLVKELRSGEPVDTNMIDATEQKTKLVALTKEKDRLLDKLDDEQDARKLLEDHVKVIGEEMNALRQGFSAAEKDKLEAQTRLEVLSTYFKEKETQLQKELSLKEAITMKQQGETSSTVERIRGLQTDIQDLRSQNDSLKAEIEAQMAAHKVQMAAVENRAHESWLSARQANRRYEEAVSEAGALRRKLTSLGDANGAGGQPDTSLPNLHRSLDAGLSGGDAPSPIHMDVSGANPAMLMGVLPPPSFLPPPFMAPPPMLPPPLNFMPPPQAPMLPFMPGQHLPPPPGEMRPPPLGRLMSPPPSHSYSPDDRYRSSGGGGGRGRYSDDDEYDSEDDHHHHNRRSHSRRHSNRSTYDTETDYSPPRSPEPRYGSRGGGPRSVTPPFQNHQSGPYSSPPPSSAHSNHSNSHPSSRTAQLNSKEALKEVAEDRTDEDDEPARPFTRTFHSIRRFWNSMEKATASSVGAGLSSGSVDSLGSRKSHHGAKV